MTDNLDRLRAANFAANWKNNTGMDAAVYHLSGVEVRAQGGPMRRCTITITFEPEEKPQHLLPVKDMAVPVGD